MTDFKKSLATDQMRTEALYPNAMAAPISAVDRNGRFVLGVVAKRTYKALVSGECLVAEDQSPLVLEPVEDPMEPELILADAEIWLDKLFTDVIVCGHTWNHEATPQWQCSVTVAQYPSKRVLASGDRSCTITATNRIVFSQPLPAEKIPLSYRFAYGGVDIEAEREAGSELAPLAEYIPEEDRDRAMAAASMWRYPRNRAGRGYLIDANRYSIETLMLPNLEDLNDQLTPERLIVEDPWLWPLQPLPASFNWLEHGMFPRLGWFGETPDWDSDTIGNRIDSFPEIKFGYAEPNLFTVGNPPRDKFDRQALNGASLGMRFPYLRGDEPIILTDLHPELKTWTVKLPGVKPNLAVDNRDGGLTHLDAQLYNVLIEPDEDRISLVFAGFSRAKRPYIEDELKEMPFLAEW